MFDCQGINYNTRVYSKFQWYGNINEVSNSSRVLLLGGGWSNFQKFVTEMTIYITTIVQIDGQRVHRELLDARGILGNN